MKKQKLIILNKALSVTLWAHFKDVKRDRKFMGFRVLSVDFQTGDVVLQNNDPTRFGTIITTLSDVVLEAR